MFDFCQAAAGCGAGVDARVMPSDYMYTLEDDVHGTLENLADLNDHASGDYSPLVYGLFCIFSVM